MVWHRTSTPLEIFIGLLVAYGSLYLLFLPYAHKFLCRYFPVTFSYWFGEFKSSSSVASLDRVELHKAASSTTVSTTMDDDDEDSPDTHDVVIQPQERSPLARKSPAASPAYGASETLTALRLENLCKVSITQLVQCIRRMQDFL